MLRDTIHVLQCVLCGGKGLKGLKLDRTPEALQVLDGRLDFIGEGGDVIVLDQLEESVAGGGFVEDVGGLWEGWGGREGGRVSGWVVKRCKGLELRGAGTEPCHRLVKGTLSAGKDAREL